MELYVGKKLRFQTNLRAWKSQTSIVIDTDPELGYLIVDDGDEADCGEWFETEADVLEIYEEIPAPKGVL